MKSILVPRFTALFFSAAFFCLPAHASDSALGFTMALDEFLMRITYSYPPEGRESWKNPAMANTRIPILSGMGEEDESIRFDTERAIEAPDPAVATALLNRCIDDCKRQLAAGCGGRGQACLHAALAEASAIKERILS